MNPRGEHLDMAGAIANIDFRAVANVAQQATLKDVRLSWSQVGVFTNYSDVESEWPFKAFGRYLSQPKSLDGPVTTPVSIWCNFAVHYFAGVDPTEVESPPEATEEDPPTLAIEAVFLLEYELLDPAETSSDDLHHFAMANGTHNAWPYWREYAQSATLRMGITPYVVPPFKLPSPDDPRTSDSHDQSGDG